LPRCRVCGSKAWVKIPWGNTWFCRTHFISYFEKKVYQTFSRYTPRIHKKLLFAVSGGKDSLAMLYSLAGKLAEEGYSLAVLFIDLGIKGYSEYARKAVEKAASDLGLSLIVVDLDKEHGFSIDELASRKSTFSFGKPICSLCGIVKRYLYNKVASDNGYDLVVTGHTLNDIYAFVMSNLTTGNLEDLVKLRPYVPSSASFVARARPLFFNYEYENRLYTLARGIDVVLQPCPHSPLQTGSLTTSFKKQLLELEKEHPGIGLMFMKNFLKKVIKSIEYSKPSQELVRCSICGMPSSSNPCSFCRIKLKLGKA